MYNDAKDIEWNEWYSCSLCKRDETILEDNTWNRQHWSWGVYKTTDKQEFAIHEKTDEHMNHYKKYKCEGCGVQCWSKSEYDIHCETSKHKKTNKIVIECKMCDYTTYSNSSMEQHNGSQKHQNNLAGIEKNSYHCDMCNYSTKFKSQFEQHELTKKHQDALKGISHKQDGYTCEHCKYKTDFKQHLDQHLKTKKHKDTVAGLVVTINLHCEKCDYHAISKGLMVQHCKSKKHNE